MSKNWSKGSEWRKWDLHFHTPASYDYKDRSVSNQQIVDCLLSNDIKVVAITDHNLMDVALIKELKSLANDSLTILPGIELCTESRGTDPIHIIGIFSEDSDAEYIWGELNVKLDISNQLHNGKSNAEVYCDLKKASKLIQELGGLVTIHAGRKSNSIEEITNALPVTMAEKKDIASHVDIFEVGQVADVENYKSVVFPKIGKEYPLILCTDNHDVKSYTQKETLWIKGNPTFEGLRQIVYEPLRAFIGAEPPIHERVAQNPTKFIDSVTITQTDQYHRNSGVWFKDVTIPLNSEMVAIIGNKGGGKSAIADILGYVGGAKTVVESNGASFLNRDKFRKNELASNFTATLTWKSKDLDEENLQTPKNEHTAEKVKYLPQHWFEELCNDLDGKKFNEELEKVVFSHLDPSERIAHDSFAELIREKSHSANQEIMVLKAQLTEVNTTFVEIQNKLHPNYKVQLEETLKQKQRELEAHKKSMPVIVAQPVATDSATESATQQISQLNTSIATLEQQIRESVILLTDIKKRHQELNNFEAELLRLQREVVQLNLDYDLSKIAGEVFEQPIFSFSFEQEVIDRVRKNLSTSLVLEEQKHFDSAQIENIPSLTDDKRKIMLDSSIVNKLVVAKSKRDELKKQLSKPQEKYQKYLEDKKIWEITKLKIEGDVESPVDGTLNHLKKAIKSLETVVPKELEELKLQQRDLSKQIFDQKYNIVRIYETIKQQVDDVLQRGVKSIEDYIISVEAGFQLSPHFISETTRHINLRAKGSFMETDNAREQIKKLTEESTLQTFNEVYDLSKKMLHALQVDNRPEVDMSSRSRFLADQIKSPVEFLDHLFGLDYLKTNYQLKLDQKNLESLSPGEKGALLLVFYLMLDQDDIPLVIDQPEDNLDNESVAKILVKFIKEAKNRRQIIMVTHNPNLAVVADAEQVVYVHLDKTNNNTFSFISGAIESDEVNRKIVDVLEGTMPAFDKRRLRYLKQG